MEGPANTKKFPQGNNILRSEEDYREDSSLWYTNIDRNSRSPFTTYFQIPSLVSVNCEVPISSVVAFRGIAVNHKASQHRQSQRSRQIVFPSDGDNQDQ